MNQGFRSMVCQHANAIRPPGARCAWMLVNAVTGSSKNITPNWLMTTSKGALDRVLLHVGDRERDVVHARAWARCAASSVSATEMSAPVAVPAGPTSRAAPMVAFPPPEPTSSTLARSERERFEQERRDRVGHRLALGPDRDPVLVVPAAALGGVRFGHESSGIQSPCASMSSSTRPVDLIEVQLGGGVRVEHGGVIDVLALAGQRGFHRQRLHVDVGLHQRRQLRRQRPDVRRLQAGPVDQARHLHAAAGGQVVDQPVVGHVAIDHARLAGLQAVDDRGARTRCWAAPRSTRRARAARARLPNRRSARRSGAGTRPAGC